MIWYYIVLGILFITFLILGYIMIENIRIGMEANIEENKEILIMFLLDTALITVLLLLRNHI